MARIFLDANIVIDLAEERRPVKLEQFGGHRVFISPLSLHILAYTYKYKIPEKRLSTLYKHVTIVPCDVAISLNSLSGPTSDFEDNVQLHSAAYAECDLFITEDKLLLDLAFFGKVHIMNEVVV